MTTHITLSRGRRRSGATVAGAAALSLSVAVLYAPTFAWLADRVSAPGSYYSHAPLVPLLALALAWRRRRDLDWGERPATVPGGALLLAGALLHLAAAALRVHFLAALSLLPVLLGLVLLFGGRTAGRRLAFPILFLVFAVPLPLWAVANLALELKLVAAEGALSLFRGLGLVAIRDGAVIHLGGGSGSLVVGEVCGGLRYTVALLALGALLAHLSTARLWVKAALLLLAAPAALAANVARVFFLLLLAKRWGAGAVTGWVHDASGLILFAVATGLLLLTDRALGGHRGGAA